MKEYSFGLFRKCGQNIFDKNYYSFKNLRTQLRRDPALSDFDPYNQGLYKDYLAHKEVIDIIQDETVDLYVRLNNGARKGSIVKMVGRPRHTTLRTSTRPGIAHDADMTVCWDDGKTWMFKVRRNIEDVDPADQHTLLVGYEGPTVFCFEKKPRVKEDAPELRDNYGRVIEVGHWVMNDQFKIGKVKRISSKGTLWIEMLSMKSGRYQDESKLEQFGRSSIELLRVDLPEGFEVTATIMDKDVTGLDIVPTFTYDVRHD